MDSGLVSSISWSVRWRQVGQYAYEHIMYEECMPVLFRTRNEARKWIEKKYGYIRNRKDLRSEPHCWRMPMPIKVQVVEVLQ